ncbi:MAG: hypothetical protein PVG80_11730, partial [Gammaproteobacteria bacterium]
MKSFFSLALAVFIMSPVGADETGQREVIRLSDPVEVTDAYEVFGSPVGEVGDVTRLSEVISREGEFLDKQVRVSARVAKV